MLYRGKFDIFNPHQINTYPLAARANKTKIEDMIWPAEVENLRIDYT